METIISKLLPTDRILVCFASFKGTLTAFEATDLAAEFLSEKGFQVKAFPMGDGGRGTAGALHRALGGEWIWQRAQNPLGETIQAKVLCFPDAESPDILFVESAETIGFHLTPPEKRHVLTLSSRGLGVVLKGLAERFSQVSEIIVGLGDSGISDGGIGLLEGMGFQFFDSQRKLLPAKVSSLSQIRSWQAPELSLPKLTVWCDVTNPLIGKSGAAPVFAPQKGATAEEIAILVEQFEGFGEWAEEEFKEPLALRVHTGAAGGTAFALKVFLGAELVPGAESLMESINLRGQLSQSDVILTGEGSTDEQTFSGKAPYECVVLAIEEFKRWGIISGQISEKANSLFELPGSIGAIACGQTPTAAEALAQALSKWID